MIIDPMQNHSSSIWRLRIATFSVAALAAASATYWTLKWVATAPQGQTASVIFSDAPATDPLVVARVLGGGQIAAPALLGAPAQSAASRLKLTGVVADRFRRGYALISIDGKPAKPYRVGALVNDALVLHSVAPRSAALAASLDAPVALTLDLPKLNLP